jgi:hypothetical protein
VCVFQATANGEELDRYQLFALAMKHEVTTHLRPFLKPLMTYALSKAHMYLALALDPKHKGFGVVCAVTTT